MLNSCVVVVSDLHCGSIFGMLPPDFFSSADAPIAQNPLQSYLWLCWTDFSQRVANLNGKIRAVVVNGDIVDGRQQAQRGTELCLPLIEDQAGAAEACLKFLRRHTGAAKWYFTQGTEYHDAKAGREVEVVARTLGAQSYGSLTAGTGNYSREFLDLDLDGVIMNFAHGISVTSGFYRATAADREGIWSALAGKEGKLPKADAVLRAHCHFFVHVEHASKHIVTAPCWQGQTRFMRKNSVYRMLPDIGGLIIWFDPELKKKGEDPIVVRKVLYGLPPIPTTKG